MTHPLATASARLAPMRPRDPHEHGRTASTLELFFDLVFVVAVSVTASELHHALSDAHVLAGVLAYLAVFFGIWWAWMNFTWFATSFATDDWLYRVLTLVQMGGVLVLAAGVEPVFVDRDFTVVVAGYVLMRVALVAQWLRAARGGGRLRRTALTYAGGITLVQLAWLVLLLLPHTAALVGFAVLVLAELAVPVLAERRGTTPWHPHHITERYGLFTLILLGESLLASANAVIEALHDEAAVASLAAVSVFTLVVTAALWWLYFWPAHHRAITTLRASLLYGYGHFLLFAAAGAFSAGIEVEIDALTGHGELGRVAASMTVAVPVAGFLLCAWWFVLRQQADRVVNAVVPAAAVVVLLDPLVSLPFALTALAVVLVVVVLVVRAPVPAVAIKLPPPSN